MPSPATLAVFSAAALVLLVVPGPAVMYVVVRSAREGRRRGLASVLGLHVGTLTHVVAAASGLSALLVASAAAFTVVKWAGAAYLIWLGIRSIRHGERPPEIAPAGSATAFRQGVLVNLLNPKLALFFLAFLPQFVEPGRGPVVAQVAALGVVFVVLGVLSDGAYALAASAVGRRFAGRGGRAARYLTGGVYITLGAATLAGANLERS